MRSQIRYLALSVLVGSFVSGTVMAEQVQIGESEFKSHCAGCHGLDGQGNGPFVEFLKKKPPSLTTLARDNQRVFPFQQVYDVIDGTSQISAHGSSDMPIWGNRYAMEIITQYGEYATEHPKTVRCRILELVFYIANLQE